MRKRKNPNDRLLKAVKPNQGIEAEFRRCLTKLVEAMHRNVLAVVSAAYSANEPLIAQDALPATELKRAIQEMVRKWNRRFDLAGPRLAKYFSQDISKRSDAQLTKILKDAGITVKFKMTKAAQDIMSATIAQQVGLIKSIPTQYLQQVEGAVMRSVQQGRDLKTLTDELQRSYGATRKRAILIARDQSNKATASITRARQVEIGVTKAIWVHSGGGKEPRPTHVKAGRNQVEYDVTKGMWDPDANGKGKGAWIFPGELINCRCLSKSVIPGFV